MSTKRFSSSLLFNQTCKFHLSIRYNCTRNKKSNSGHFNWRLEIKFYVPQSLYTVFYEVQCDSTNLPRNPAQRAADVSTNGANMEMSI